MTIEELEVRVRTLEQTGGVMGEKITTLTAGMAGLQTEMGLFRKSLYVAIGAWIAIQFIGPSGILRALGGHQ